MIRFTTWIKAHTSAKTSRMAIRLGALAFWLAVWELAYRLVAQEILLVSPAQALSRLWELAWEELREGWAAPETGPLNLPGKLLLALRLLAGSKFWGSVLASCLRVLAGFGLGVGLGSLLAALSARWRVARELLGPLLGAVRATPVASFIILALFWQPTGRVPVLVAFVMVLPLVWANVHASILATDGRLLEMARVYRMPPWRVLRCIYLPQVAPGFVAACSTGLGFAWKSAIAAEVIALPSLAVGRQIYNSKIYLNTADLFAWTIAVVLLSVLLEKTALLLLDRLKGSLLRAG